MTTEETFGAYLRRVRREKGIGMQAIAARYVCEDGKVGCDPGNLYAIEREDNRNLTRDLVVRAAEAYGIPVDEALLIAGFTSTEEETDIPDDIRYNLQVLEAYEREVLYAQIRALGQRRLALRRSTRPVRGDKRVLQPFTDSHSTRAVPA